MLLKSIWESVTPLFMDYKINWRLMSKVFHRIYHKVFELISTILLVLTIMMDNPVYDMLVVLAVNDFHQVVTITFWG